MERLFALADRFASHLIEESRDPAVVFSFVCAAPTAAPYQEGLAAVFAVGRVDRCVTPKTDGLLMIADDEITDLPIAFAQRAIKSLNS